MLPDPEERALEKRVIHQVTLCRSLAVATRKLCSRRPVGDVRTWREPRSPQASGYSATTKKHGRSRAFRKSLREALLLRLLVFDVLDDVAHGLQFLRVFVRHFDVEL